MDALEKLTFLDRLCELATDVGSQRVVAIILIWESRSQDRRDLDSQCLRGPASSAPELVAAPWFCWERNSLLFQEILFLRGQHGWPERFAENTGFHSSISIIVFIDKGELNGNALGSQ
jgi:hypothetical protein